MPASPATFCHFSISAFDVRRVLLECVSDRDSAATEQLLANNRILQGFHQRRIEFIRNGARHARRPEEAEPAADDKAGKSGFLHGRNIGYRRRACLPHCAIMRSLPPRTCSITTGMLGNDNCTCPAIRSTMPGAMPLYGTCTSLILACALSSSPARWPTAPADRSWRRKSALAASWRAQ